MKVHHLDCVSSCPLFGRLMDGRSPYVLGRGRLCCHCLLLETDDAGLVLVDTGYGLEDVAHPHARLSSFFLAMLAPDFRPEMTARRQVERLGFRAEDVRHIVLTHLDFDHAGGLDDFPAARIHLLQPECEAALAQRTWLDRQRFRPQQWGSRARWRTYTRGGDAWQGFEGTLTLEGLPPEIALVPLHGHTFGHCGVAIRTDERWLLQAGDAYFHHDELDALRPRCPPGLSMYQRLMEKDRAARLGNQQRLRALARDAAATVTICCAHDPAEFERHAGRPAGRPAGRSP